MEFLNGMIQWLTQDLLVSLLDESVFWMNLLNEWFKDKYILTAPFRHLKKKMCTHELIGGSELLILQVSDSWH